MVGHSVVNHVVGILDKRATRPLILALFFLAGIVCLSQGSPLGWDESVYAARAKDLVDSDFTWGFRSGSYWSDVRAPGLPVLMSLPFKVFGASDFVARLVVLCAAVGVLVLIGRILDLFWERRVGSAAILMIALCPGFLATSTVAFADMPAMMAGLSGVYVLARYWTTSNPRWLVPLPILLGVTSTIRFGGLFLVVGPLCVLGVMLLVRQLRTRDWHALRSFALAVVASGVIVTVMLATRFLTTHRSPLEATSALTKSNDNASFRWLDDLHAVLEPGPVDYGFNGAFWGWSYAIPFILIAVVAISRLVIRQSFWLLALCGFVTLVPLVLYSYSVNQFVTTYLAPIFASGAAMVAVGLFADSRGQHSVDEADSDVSEPDKVGVGIAFLDRFGLGDRRIWCSTIVVGSIALVGLASTQGVVRMHERLFRFDQVRVAAVAADDVLGQGCKVVTSRVPQASWYSECQTGFVRNDLVLGDKINDDEDLAKIGRVVGAGPGQVVGLLLLDGVSGEPSIDDIWRGRVEERSLLLTATNGRRVGLIALLVP